MTDTSPVPGDGPTEREHLEDETARELRRLATAIRGMDWLTHEGAAIVLEMSADLRPPLAARTPAPSAAQALRDFAAHMREDFGPAWGGDLRWITTGTHVAELVASLLEGDADRLDAAPTDPGTRDVEALRRRRDGLCDVADRWAETTGPGHALARRARDKVDGIDLAARLLGVDLGTPRTEEGGR